MEISVIISPISLNIKDVLLGHSFVPPESGIVIYFSVHLWIIFLLVLFYYCIFLQSSFPNRLSDVPLLLIHLKMFEICLFLLTYFIHTHRHVDTWHKKKSSDGRRKLTVNHTHICSSWKIRVPYGNPNSNMHCATPPHTHSHPHTSQESHHSTLHVNW